MIENIKELPKLLAEKNLDLNLFASSDLSLNHDISEHVAWLHQHIYSKAYPKHGIVEGIARPIHGIHHATRVMISTLVFANLFRRYGDEQALALTDSDIKLIQIAALFHDSAREDENEDRWDKDSGLLLYHYLTRVLRIDDLDKAKILAEAIANKDSEKDNYYELIDLGEGKYGWKKSEQEHPRNIYQKLIHDADSLDIMRVLHFRATYLDFYKEIVKYKSQDFNKEAFNEMDRIINEVRGILKKQGDDRFQIQMSTKKQYEHADAYAAIIKNIFNNEHCKLFKALFNENQLLSANDLRKKLLNDLPADDKTINTESLTVAMNEGRLLARGITAPSLTPKEHFVLEYKTEISDAMLRLMAQLDLIDAQQNGDISNKSLLEIELDAMNQSNGNDFRSTNLIGHGASLYTSPAFLIKDPKMELVRSVSNCDQATGLRKKEEFSALCPRSDLEDIKKQWQALIENQMLGGSSVIISDVENTHNEVTYCVQEVHGILFSNDHTPTNAMLHGHLYPLNPYTQYLQALYIQKKYEEEYGIKLPIIEYFGDDIRVCQDYSDEEIVKMWVSIMSDLINHEFRDNIYLSENLDALKIKAIYGPRVAARVDTTPKVPGIEFFRRCSHTELEALINKMELEANRNTYLSVDLYYSPELKKKIDDALQKECNRISWYKNIENFKEAMANIFSDEGSYVREIIKLIFQKISPADIDRIYEYDDNRFLQDSKDIESQQLHGFFNSYRTDFKSSIQFLIKIYFVALKSDEHGWIIAARQEAKNIIAQGLSKIADKFIARYSDMKEIKAELKKMLEYAMTFDLLTDYKNNIKPQLLRYLNLFYTIEINSQTIEFFFNSMNDIAKAGFWDESIDQNCREIFETFKRNCAVYHIKQDPRSKYISDQFSEIEYYLANIPQETLTVLLSTLKQALSVELLTDQAIEMKPEEEIESPASGRTQHVFFLSPEFKSEKAKKREERLIGTEHFICQYSAGVDGV